MKYEQAAPGEPIQELVEMRDHREYKVCKDSSDPRGWTVRAQDHRDVGRVTDLIIDEVALNARYLVCNYGLESKSVLIPTGFARFDDKQKLVHLDFLTRSDIARLPAYQGLPLSTEQQAEVETALTGREQFEAQSIIQRRVDRSD